MNLPKTSAFQFTSDLNICRILNGMWQVSGTHGQINPARAIEDMFAYFDAGFSTWDLADHYGPAEDFIGAFRRKLANLRGSQALSEIQAFTKWVPNPHAMTKSEVRNAVNVSLTRMDVQEMDLLQFHWWDYQNDSYLSALTYLSELCDEGKIRYIGLTNFDTEHLNKVIDQGVTIVSNQVQYSLIDQRPAVKMGPYCKNNNVHILAYGTLCGGLISKKYLGQLEPAEDTLDTPSLWKYKQFVDGWGGWELFQTLLGTLDEMARKHAVSIPNVAVRYVLRQPAVAGVIVGARLGLTNHREDNVRLFKFDLDAEDLGSINDVVAQSHDLYELIGDCGDEYR